MLYRSRGIPNASLTLGADGFRLRPLQCVLGIAHPVLQLVNVGPSRGGIVGHTHGRPLPETVNNPVQCVSRQGRHADGPALLLMLLQ